MTDLVEIPVAAVRPGLTFRWTLDSNEQVASEVTLRATDVLVVDATGEGTVTSPGGKVWVDIATLNATNADTLELLRYALTVQAYPMRYVTGLDLSRGRE